MNKGKVNWFNNKKGYGFISVENGSDIFVHYSEIKKEGYKSLKENDEVVFNIGSDKNGRSVAINVNLAK